MSRFSLLSPRIWSLAIVALGSAWTVPVQATLAPGDIALIGWIDNGSPDSFVFVTLAPIAAGEELYFTDNGWTGSQFRGAGNTGLIDGDGNEGILKWTALADIPAGRIFNSIGSGSNFIWTRGPVGGIPGANTGQFTDLSLQNPGEQIYAFQAPQQNPLFNPTNHLFVLDDSGAFEAAFDNSSGDVPPGLTPGTTALTFPSATAGEARYIAFNTNSLSTGTKAQWLTAIADQNNWIFGAAGVLPGGAIDVTAVPEPSTALALVGGLAVLLTGRKRRG